MNKQSSESGFALLVSLIVVGVVLSVGISLLDLSVKQVRLSSNAKESELAFHAANAGLECARYWRRQNSDEMEIGQVINPTCFGSPVGSNTITSLSVTGDGKAFLYDYQFTWGGTDARCTSIKSLVASSTALGAGMTVTNMLTHIPGYPDGNTKVCDPGSRCTVISVQGYNKPCSAISGYGVVQREVLLQF